LIKLRERLAEENPKDYDRLFALVLNNLGSMYRSEGRFAETEPLYNRALILRKKLYVENPTDDGCKNKLATQFYRLGLLFEQMEKQKQAKESWQQALDIWETMDEDSIGNNMEYFEDTRRKMGK